jgi:TusA-related sulfurtransferase
VTPIEWTVQQLMPKPREVTHLTRTVRRMEVGDHLEVLCTDQKHMESRQSVACSAALEQGIKIKTKTRKNDLVLEITRIA